MKGTPEEFENGIEVNSEEILPDLHEAAVMNLSAEVPTAAEEIEMLQQRKEAIFGQLEADLERMEDEGEVGDVDSMRHITFNSSKKRLMSYDNTGRQKRVRNGELKVSATMWGESYYMGTEVPEDKKRDYLLDRSRYQIDELYDQQVAAAEVVRWEDLNEGRSDAYAMVRHHFENPDTLEDGHIAEKMVESFLTKLALDYKVPYEIESVSVVDDIQYKIDFVLKPKRSTNEVAVGVVDAPEIGVQFTTARDQMRIKHKKAQIKQAKKDVSRSEDHQVSDIILLEMPLKGVRQKYNQWHATPTQQREPGGPDMLWSMKDRAQIYKKTMLPFIERGEIAKEDALSAIMAYAESQ